MKTQLEIDNKVIDKFMGIDLDEFKTVSSWTPTKYNESWDLLIPVVEKINASGLGCLTINREDIYLHRYTNAKREELLFFRVNPMTTIQCVYKAVLQFIHWYNSLSK